MTYAKTFLAICILQGSIALGQTPDQYESDNSRAAAGNIPLGVKQARNISPQGDVDWIRFAPPSTGAYKMTVTTNLTLTGEGWVKQGLLPEIKTYNLGARPETPMLMQLNATQGTDYYKFGLWAASRTATGNYWVIIERFNNPPTKPANPSPGNGIAQVLPNQSMSWSCSDPDGDALKYDVYFGTTSSPPKLVSDQSGTNYKPSSLQLGLQYYWKVVAKDGKGGETSGDVWSFRTKANSPPTKPFNPSPANGAVNVSTSPTFTWTCSDPDGEALKYDVYFGTTSNPSKVASDQVKQNYLGTALKSKTKYYWKVVAKDGSGGQTAGDVWSFTTK